MFERFTERARQVVVLAQDEARLLGHGHIGTEHLLLGLLREEEGLAARSLVSLGVTLEAARDAVGATVAPRDPPRSGQIPFTPQGKRVLEFALREALSLGHNHIGTEHLLLGLVREGDDVTLTVLEELGLGADRIRDEVIAAISGAPPRPPLPRRQRRWDYAVYTLGALDTDDGTLANIGGEGWELVAVVGEPGAYRGVFKRPR